MMNKGFLAGMAMFGAVAGLGLNSSFKNIDTVDGFYDGSKVTTCEGDVWEISTNDSSNLQPNTNVTLTYDNNGTETYKDDKLLNVETFNGMTDDELLQYHFAILVGYVDNKDGDGHLVHATDYPIDEQYNYINYSKVNGYKIGDKILTIIYIGNEDDVKFRYDVIL